MSAKAPPYPLEVAPAAKRFELSAARILAGGGLAVLLYVAHTAFVPIALAGLFALILSGPVEALHRRRVPRTISAALMLIIAFAILGGAVDAAWVPAQDWFAKAPQTVIIVKQRVSPISDFMGRVQNLGKSPNARSSKTRTVPPAVTESSVKDNAPLLILDNFGPAMAGLLTFVIVTLFLLTGGPLLLARLSGPFADHRRSSHVLILVERVRQELGRFYFATTIINLGVGALTSALTWAWGMPTPILWGTVAALLNYIPYAGPGTTALVITFAALVTFDTLGPAFGVAGSFLLITLIEGQFVQPLLIGRRMKVNPLLIFLALWFGGLYWGIAGIVLATPALVALKVIAANTKDNESLLKFLSPIGS